MNNLEVLKYDDPNEFLRDVWLSKKESNPSFSIRAWSRQMGHKHHSLLYEMIKGKRLISKSFFYALVEYLMLNEIEAIFLETLIELKKTSRESERSIYVKRLACLRRARSLTLSLTEEKYIEFNQNIGPFLAQIRDVYHQAESSPKDPKRQKNLAVKIIVI